MASKAADSTIFIEFMLSSILAALNELPVKKITDIIPDKLTDKLTKAELLFLEAVGGYLENNDELTNFRAQLLTNKSAESVKKYLQKLVQLGVLKTSGENKGRKYRLVIKNNYGDGIQVYQCQKRCDLAPKNGL
jgi:Fic family protein